MFPKGPTSPLILRLRPLSGMEIALTKGVLPTSYPQASRSLNIKWS